MDSPVKKRKLNYEPPSTLGVSPAQLPRTARMPKVCSCKNAECPLVKDVGERLEHGVRTKRTRSLSVDGGETSLRVDKRKDKVMRRERSAAVTESGTPPRQLHMRARSSTDDFQSFQPATMMNARAKPFVPANSSKLRVPWQDERRPVSEFNAQLEQEHKCPICLDVYDFRTRASSCGHSMCLECLSAWITHRIRFGKRPNCPVCKTVLGGMGYGDESIVASIRDAFKVVSRTGYPQSS